MNPKPLNPKTLHRVAQDLGSQGFLGLGTIRNPRIDSAFTSLQSHPKGLRSAKQISLEGLTVGSEQPGTPAELKPKTVQSQDT